MSTSYGFFSWNAFLPGLASLSIYIYMQLQLPGEHCEGEPGGPHHVEDGHDE